MKTYFISLEQDTQRRTELAQRFTQNYPEMQWIKAINGKELSAKEYFSYVQQFFNIYKKIITPSEVGCTLSHMKALEKFLETEDGFCLILEDDVIGKDLDIELIKRNVVQSDLNGLLLLMDQRFYNYDKYILGKLTPYFYQLPRFSIKFVLGTCSYALDRETARYMLQIYKNNIDYADAWYKIYYKSKIPFYYSAILKHPSELNDSRIENERSKIYMNEKNFFKRIYKQGVFWKIYNRIRNDIWRWILILKGYKQIHKGKH